MRPLSLVWKMTRYEQQRVFFVGEARVEAAAVAAATGG